MWEILKEKQSFWQARTWGSKKFHFMACKTYACDEMTYHMQQTTCRKTPVLSIKQSEGKQVSRVFAGFAYLSLWQHGCKRGKSPDLIFPPTYFPRPLQVRTHHRQNSGAKMSYIRPPGKWIPWLRKLSVLKMSHSRYSLPQIANDIYWDFISIFYPSSNDL